MAEEGGDLLHLHLLAAGGAEPDGLELRGGCDEGAVVPESDGVRHRGVPLREQLLEVLHPEQIRYRLIAAVHRGFALPSLVTYLLLLGRRRPATQIHRTNHHHHRHQQNRFGTFASHPHHAARNNTIILNAIQYNATDRTRSGK